MKEKNKPNRFADGLKWLLVVLLVVTGIVGNIHYAAISPALRLVAGIVLALIALFVAAQTTKGRIAWKYLNEARDEIRRVVWPTRQATLQVALVVLVMVVIAATVIFVFDQIFVWLIAWLTGQRG